MNQLVKKLPIPITGLMLALAATGNLVQSYGEMYRNIFGVLSAIILVLVIIKILKFRSGTSESLENPVVASVFPTLSMGIILLSAYINKYVPTIAFGVWVLGLILHIIFIIKFTIKYISNFNIKKVFPSWFIVYVGIVCGSVTAPAFNMTSIGKIIFWFGLLSYLVLLPITLKRVFKIKEIPEPALPTIVIFSAPTSLCLAGYMNSFQDKNMLLVLILLVVSQITYLCVLTQLPRLLKLKFYPSYSAFTFPLVISAISLKLTNGFLTKVGTNVDFLKYVVKFEELLAVVIVLYVAVRYIRFLFTKTEVTVK